MATYMVCWRDNQHYHAKRSSIQIEADSTQEAIDNFNQPGGWSMGGRREIVQIWKLVASMKPALSVEE